MRLKTCILGKMNPDEVIYDLELVDHLDVLGLDVQWISEDNELVSSDGRIGDIAEEKTE